MAHDLRYAIRRIGQSPGVALVAMLTIAIGVGANAAIVSVIRATVLAPRPYVDADRLVVLGERWPTRPGPRPISRLNYLDWAAQNTVFEQMAAVSWGDATIGRGNDPVHVEGSLVSPSYFDVFGLHAAIGRTFAPGEDEPGRNHVVVLSHRLWTSQFGRDPSIVGTSVRLDGESYTVIGVMPAGMSVEFGFDLADPQLWRPRSGDPAAPRGAKELRGVVARLKRDVTFERARAEMDTIGDRLAREYPDTNSGYGVIVQHLPRAVGLQFKESLYLLFAAASVVFLLACVNLANLALARGATRGREVAIRAALGARPLDLLRPFLAEHLLIALCGGLGGAFLSYGVLALLKAAIPTTGLRAGFPSETTISVDIWAWLFGFALAAVGGLACGLTSGVAFMRRSFVAGMREGSAGGGASRAHQRLQRALVAAQIALAFALLTGTSLLIQSFSVLTNRISAGFDATNVVTARLPVPENRFESGAAFNAYLDEIAVHLQEIPGVRGVAFADALPTEGTPYGKLIQIVGQPTVPYANRPIAGFKVVTASYFSVVGLHVLEGRRLADSDRADAPLVAVISVAMARTWFPDVSPIGQRLILRRSPFRGLPDTVDLVWTIVGLIADEGVSPFDDRTAQPAIYVTGAQHPRLAQTLVVRTDSDPVLLQPAMRKAVAAVNPDQALTDVTTLTDLEAADLAPDWLRSILLSTFAVIAVTLAALGLYGVVAYSIVERTRELGIRAALGASPGRLQNLVLRQVATMIALGLGAGLAASIAGMRLIAAFLYGVRPSDPATMVTVAAVLSVVALMASYVPARRATAIDPLVALKSE